MKIALFHHLPDGGAKIALYEQVKRLKDRHTIDLFTFIAEPGEYDLRPFCERIFLYPYEALRAEKHGLPRICEDLRSFSALRRIHREIAQTIDKGEYQVAYIHQSRLTQAPYLLGFLQTPNVYYCQEPLRMVYEYGLRLQEDLNPIKRGYESLNRFIRKKIDRDSATSACLILTSSHFASEYITLAYGVHPQISPLGVDANIFRPIPGIKRDGLLFVAQRSWLKGFSLVKEALALIPKTQRPKLTVIAPPKTGKFKYPRKEMARAYPTSQATLATSILEPFGLMALESMACETPVIAVKEGGYRETVIDGKQDSWSIAIRNCSPKQFRSW